MDIDEIYDALSYAETGGEKNPNIRTKVRTAKGGSSAFGKAQITGKLAAGAKKNKYLSKESEKFYDEVMKDKYKKMLYHGNMKGKIKDYNPRYDYGGDAEFDEEKHGKAYDEFAKDIIKGVLKEAKDDEKEFVRKWRGKNEKQDPEYFKRYEERKKQKQLEAEMKRQIGGE